MDTFGNYSSDQIIVFGLIILSLLFIAYGFFSAYRSKIARNWPVAEGIVTLSAIEVSYSRDKNGRRRKNEKHVFFYEYEVGGEMHTASRIAFGFTIRSARTLFNLYPPNKQISIFYDPNNPEKCCLEPGRIAGSIAAIVLGLGMLTFLAFYLK